MSFALDEYREWLETDGLGGFASGTTAGLRTRRYHALLLAAANPPTGRFVLVNGVDARVVTANGEFPICFQRYAPGVTCPADGVAIEAFDIEPWPRWVLRLGDGTLIGHEVFLRHGSPMSVVTWKVLEGDRAARLRVRPLLSGRDYHALHHENGAFCFEPHTGESSVAWSPYPGVPSVTAHHNGVYRHEPVWYRGFLYEHERDRGFDCVEDLASPGVLEFDLAGGEAAVAFLADAPGEPVPPLGTPIDAVVRSLRAEESHRRRQLGSRLERTGDAYIVRRRAGATTAPGSEERAVQRGLTILAGYPWFADWGRDTFIALRGLCIATGRVDDARSILLRWSGTVSEGMIPNRFPDSGGEPEYNSVDASLWFAVAVHDLLERASIAGGLPEEEATVLRRAVLDIVAAYAGGTRYGIRMDADGLLASGEPGVQLTWMDARVGDRVVTPRVGKPVEVQALWINALWIASRWNARWEGVYLRALRSFRSRFWNKERDCLFDVIDVDHVAGDNDASMRPNQVLAVGGLPLCLLDQRRARVVVDRVEASLLTPLGLRSLGADEPGYAPMYRGGPEQRDLVYHQGTVWPWLIGPFVEAWLRVRPDRPGLRNDARERFLKPLLRHLDEAGAGHVSEVADAEFPHRPGGCPFQAWSLGELIRLDRVVLAAPSAGTERTQSVVRRARRRNRGVRQDPDMVEAFISHWPEYLIEAFLLGTFMIAACVAVVMVQHPASPVAARVSGSVRRRLVIGILMGLTAIALIYSPWGQRSGAHMNPGTTLTFFLLGKVRPWDAVFYVCAQFIGALAGVRFASAVLSGLVRHEAINYAATLPGALGFKAAWVGEFVISFVMMGMVLFSTNHAPTAPYTGLFAGALVAAFIVIEAPISGMSMNPARSLGSAIPARAFRGLWIYFTAPPLAMLCAAGLYTAPTGPGCVYCAKLNHQRSGPCIFNCTIDQMPGRNPTPIHAGGIEGR